MVSAIEDFERNFVGLYLIAKFHVGLTRSRDFRIKRKKLETQTNLSECLSDFMH